MKQALQNDRTLPDARVAQDRPGLAAALTAPLGWGLTGIFVRLLDELSAPAIVTGRLLIAGACLLPWLLWRRRRGGAKLDVPLAATMGGYYLLATEAFFRAPVVDVTLVIGFAPIIALGIERFRGQRQARSQLLGAAIAIVGLALFLLPARSVGGNPLLGTVLALGAALFSALYAVGLRARAIAARPADPVSLAATACLLGACVSIALLVLDTRSVPMAWSASHLGLLVALGVMSTALPTLAYGIASARLPSVVTTSFGLLTPVFAALFAGVILGEWPALASLPGAVLTIAGLVQVLRSKPA